MQEIMQRADLPRDKCAQIWDLTNPSNADTFHFPMFAIVMQFLTKSRQGHALPSAIPPELKMSAGLRDGSQVNNQGHMPPQGPTLDQQLQQDPNYNAMVLVQEPEPSFPVAQLNKPAGNVPAPQSNDPFDFGNDASQPQPQNNLFPMNNSGQKAEPAAAFDFGEPAKSKSGPSMSSQSDPFAMGPSAVSAPPIQHQQPSSISPPDNNAFAAMNKGIGFGVDIGDRSPAQPSAPAGQGGLSASDKFKLEKVKQEIAQMQQRILDQRNQIS
jgi:hypothetical protein